MRSLALVVLALAACGPDTSTLSQPDMRMPDLSMAQPMECMNGFTDGDETDEDCGGPVCAPCDAGKACKGAKDCRSGICVNKMCAAPSCADMVKNGDESDLDCGGSCMTKCAEGKSCNDGPDCASMNCVNGVCGKSPCTNMVLDGMETDVDCGGPLCDKCADGKMCGDGVDCTSGMCVNQACKSACPLGMDDCDGDAGNGCETNLRTDSRNCGACRNACPGGMPACVAGQCSAAQGKVIFITSATFTGNMGGLAGADASCAMLAKAAGLPGMFKAWLSDRSASAGNRLTHANVPYVLTDRTMVAKDWAGLTSGALLAPISITEKKGPAPAGDKVNGLSAVYTDTKETADTGDPVNGDCKMWSTTAAGGALGIQGQLDKSWTWGLVGQSCGLNLPIICVEQ